MNERIKELADEARTEANIRFPSDTFTWNGWHNCFNEKFAKLIIRECADIANSHFERKVAGYPGDKIEEHFGVEE